MDMKIRHIILPLGALVLGILVLFAAPASAQTGEAVYVIPLSKSGYEQAFALAYSPDGKYFAVGGSSGIYLFDAQKLSEIDLIQTNARARSVIFLPGSNTLAAALFDNTIKLWDVPQDRLTTTLQGHQGWVRSISASDDGSLLASASDDNTIRIWRVSDGKPLLTLDKDTQGVRAVALSPDGKLVAGALEDKTVRVWRVSDGKPVYALVGHTDWVRCLAFSPDGSLLASGSFDMTVRLWRVSDGKLVQTLGGHTSSILKVAFSPDGKTLASSAVDESIRLWQVSDGNLIRILKGYTGFIYALAFSPDGKTLASGGGDNALRLWDLDALGPASLPTAAQQEDSGDIQSTTSDCRECHHPQGQSRPARVLDVPCTACHTNGANLEWCPAFPRSLEAPEGADSYTPPAIPAGLPIESDGIAILIASPSNGETLYARNGITAPAFIVGHVFPGKNLPSALQVQLKIWSGDKNTATLITTPSPTGQFKFNLAINPGGALPYPIKLGGFDCAPCHEDYRSAAPLPDGEVRIVVNVTGMDGQQASDSRWVRVDSSEEAAVSVQVLDDVTQAPLPDLSVQTATILYGWRSRFGQGSTDANGMAQLNLETLSQVPTDYDLTIAPQVYNGQLYSSPKPLHIASKPGITSYPTVILTAHGQAGQIIGNFSGTAPTAPSKGINIWAIHLPAGPVYQTSSTPQAVFTFNPIPIGQYLIAPDFYVLAGQGLYASPQNVDLFKSPQTSLAVTLQKGNQITGKVTSQNGSALPFAWVTTGMPAVANPVNPLSGLFQIPDLGNSGSLLTASAPGYYSQSQRADSSNDQVNFVLLPRPDMRLLGWGSGQVSVPPESSAMISEGTINLDYGWIWGKGGADKPLTINLPGQAVSISNGEFALEKPVEGTGWLYLYTGTAQVKFDGDKAPVEVESRQMIALTGGAKAIPMQEAVAMALHPATRNAPVPEVIQPSLSARIQNWLVKAGIGFAQFITFITYIISLVALFAMPLYVLFFRKRRNRPDA